MQGENDGTADLKFDFSGKTVFVTGASAIVHRDTAHAAQMAEAGRGAIINLASLTSFVGVPGAVPYSASKSGILGMTRAMAAEWAPKGIRVNAIAPGYFETDMTSVFYEDKDWVARMVGSIPAGRLGDLADLTGAVRFLASSGANYIAGQCVVIDGGYLANI